MKKTVFLVVALAIATCMIFTACNFSLGGSEKVSFQYKKDDIRQNIRDLAAAQGVCITYSVTDDKKVDESEDAASATNTEKFDLVYGAFHDLYYYKNDAKECFFDLTNELGYSVFERALGEESWSRKYTLYTSTVTKETAEAEIDKTAEDFFELATQHISFDGSNMDIGSTTIAGRDCGSYSFSMKVFGVGVSYHTYVDNATGVCLGINCDVTAIAQNEDLGVFECTDFKTAYTIVVPETYVDVDVKPELGGGTEPAGEGEGQTGTEGEGEGEGEPDPVAGGEQGEGEDEGDSGIGGLTPRPGRLGEDDDDDNPFERKPLKPQGSLN